MQVSALYILGLETVPVEESPFWPPYYIYIYIYIIGADNMHALWTRKVWTSKMIKQRAPNPSKEPKDNYSKIL